MKVDVKSAVEVGGKRYEPGVQDMPDALYANVRFKELVKDGSVVLMPRDEAGVKAQASKDARAALAAQNAEQVHQAVVDSRAGKPNPSKKIDGGAEPALKSIEEAQSKLPPPAQAASPAAESPSPAQAAPPAPSAKSKATTPGEKNS